MKCQNNRDNARRTHTKFVYPLGRYEPSSPSTKELYDLIISCEGGEGWGAEAGETEQAAMATHQITLHLNIVI